MRALSTSGILCVPLQEPNNAIIFLWQHLCLLLPTNCGTFRPLSGTDIRVLSRTASSYEQKRNSQMNSESSSYSPFSLYLHS